MSTPDHPERDALNIVRAVRGPDGLFRVEGTDRLFSGEIIRTEGRTAFVGREARYCPEGGTEESGE